MDAWQGSDAYESYMGRWSRAVATTFVGWLEAPDGEWLDVGCGTGALTSELCERVGPGRVAGIDPSGAFVAACRARVGAEPDLRVGDARDLPFPSGRFDASVSGLALNFVPEPWQAVGEMYRVTRPGGSVAAYVWDYAAGMEMIRRFWDAAVALDPGAASLDEAARFPICDPARLRSLFEDAGLIDVETASLSTATEFADFEDFWRPFLGGQGPAPSYVASLSADDRERLRERLESEVSSGSGPIRLEARAWAVKSQRP